MVSLLASSLVGETAVSLEAVLDGIEQRGLSRHVATTEMGSALEHQVLKVMSQSCGLSGVVARSRANRDVGLQTGFLLVDGEIHLQSVAKRIDASLHRVARHSGVLVLLCHGR